MSKKMDAFWAIAQHSTGGAVLAFPPTPTMEGAKHIALSANEITMCYRIANIYSTIHISKDDILGLLQEAGIATGGGVLLAYGATKAGHTVANEFLNFGGSIGWTAKSILALSLTATVGFSFLAFCAT
ncbi:hypothetical protein MSj_03689 [Microcystis aeruginosa Sj]|uniref:Uncharacterized protein n=1 Tax=Microcystis aeruginosa Sj TaxID=1979544 RepID=A0A2Z6UWA0_MICAE|nr:hypothetical protein [Microcystis aeruginosa]GBL12176.1 hypothetical protein MSj_03689 [Microcystis aeruginosa Sj]